MTAGALSGRGAVVTGGGRGIGAAVARRLSQAGAAVVVAARTAGEIEAVARALRESGARAWAVACDVTDESSVRNLAESARAHLGAVDVLAHCAGAAASAPLRKITLAEWNHLLAANATSAFLCAREFVPAMVEHRWGRIVAIASVAGLEGGRYISHYGAAKHAVVGFVRSLARELAGTGVTANAVCPGYVGTPMTEQVLANVEKRAGLGREEALAAVLKTTGQTRLLEPDEVAAAVLGLCLEESGTTNGEAIVVQPDGSAS